MVDSVRGVISRVELSCKSVERSRILHKVGDVKDGLRVWDAVALKVVIETTAWGPDGVYLHHDMKAPVYKYMN